MADPGFISGWRLLARLVRYALRRRRACRAGRAGSGGATRVCAPDRGCVAVMMDAPLLPLLSSVFGVISFSGLMRALDARLTLRPLCVLPLITPRPHGATPPPG